MAKVLMVTPYPPQPDGIAAYAVQAVKGLRAAGDEVEVLSPGPSAAHHHLELRGVRGALALAKRVRAYDRVVIQFHPDFFYTQPLTSSSIAKETAALLVAVQLARHVEVRVHEVDYRWGRRRDLTGWLTRRLWNRVDTISVHTVRERQDLIESFGVDGDRVHLVEHGSDFVPHTTLDQVRARATIGIPEGVTSFLAIGFIQRHKGFDRAVRAFRQLGIADQARLDVVGAVRVEDEGNLTYLEELEELVASTPGAHLHAGFLTDEAFDRWIVASDALVLPYRSIWSSSVLERAVLFGRPVIATDVGGLRDQAGAREGVTIVRDDAGLALAMAAVMAPHADRAEEQEGLAWPEEGSGRDAVQQAVLARAAAARGHPEPVVVPDDERIGERRFPVRSGDALRRMPGLGLPEARGRASLVKLIVRKLTAWELDPVIHHVNTVHKATLDALDDLRGGDGAGGSDQRGRTATSRTKVPPGK